MTHPFGERTCRVCGCTQTRACVDERGACWWVDDDLCSHCDSGAPARFPWFDLGMLTIAFVIAAAAILGPLLHHGGGR